ncbi:MAG: VacJ family lipoprotein [Steroidobacterales bacterium]
MQQKKRAAMLALAIALGACALGGCAALPNGEADPRDRFERFNRAVYKFNTALDHAVFRPVARTYRNATPAPVRRSVGNFTANLEYPQTIINNFLQAKFSDSAADTLRLLVNTTVGIGGLFDPATRMGLERHDEDFGQTLGRWGMPSGPYLMLPFLGPSTVRDTFALLPDEYTTARAYINDPYVRWSLYAVGKVNERALLLDTDNVIEQAYDPYAFVRNAWLQRREYKVRDGDVPPEDELLDDSGADTTPAPGGAPTPGSSPAPATKH